MTKCFGEGILLRDAFFTVHLCKNLKIRKKLGRNVKIEQESQRPSHISRVIM